MKKIALFIVAVMLLMSIPFMSSAYYYNGFTYSEKEDGTIEIEDLDIGMIGEIVIPETIGGKTVTSIKARAFGYNERITAVTIPSTVTVIGKGAFEFCTSLESITLSEGLEVISEDAFQNCDKLMEITIPYSVGQIHPKSFFGCDKLETAYIYSKAEAVANSAFEACVSLEEVYLSGTVKELDEAALKGCDKLLDIYYQGEEGNLLYDKSGLDVNRVTIHYSYEHEGFYKEPAQDDNNTGGDSVNVFPVVLIGVVVIALATVAVIVIKKRKK